MMKTLKTHRRTWITGLVVLLLATPGLLFLPGCTDLEPETFGVITPDEFYQTEEEIIAAMAPIYAQLRAALWSYYNPSQISSDETLVPTRGQDWFDNGRWLEMHRHTWSATSAMGAEDLNGSWNDAFTGVARANGLLQSLEGAELPNKEAIEAEVRVLRAFYYYLLMDLFGNIPIVGDDEFTVDPDNPPANEPRSAVFNFIEQELLAVRDALPEQWDAANRGRVTRYVADALLASIYLNAEVFTGEVTASGLQRGQARWQDADAAASRIINSGVFALEEDWFKNFSVDNHDSQEFIFFVGHLAESGLGMTFAQRTLHYNQLSPSPWNGFSTLAEVYNQFDESDPRRNIFLVGQAVNYETGEPVNDRQGNPLIFTPEIDDITNATEGEGIRVLKWEPDLNNDGGNHGNDYAFFRLAEMYLIKAEALNEMGNIGAAVDNINVVRARVGQPPLNAGDFNQASLREQILSERLRELTWEAKRRQDLIRHGKFTEPWDFKQASDPYRILFPIPQPQINANPNLVQNPGY